MKILITTLKWLVIVTFLILAFLLVKKQIKTDFVVHEQPHPYDVKAMPGKSGGSTASQSTSSITSAAVEEQRDPGDVAVVDHWFKLKGYSVVGEETYAVYSNEQLLEMMKQGDVTAFDTLSGRYISQGDLTKAYEVIEQSISYGSLNGIMRARGKYTVYMTPEDSPEQREKNKHDIKMDLSYLELMSLRGAAELHMTHVPQKILLADYRNAYGEDLTPEDYQWISNKGQELYDHYQMERNKLGLGDFDNEMPSEVKKFLGL